MAEDPSNADSLDELAVPDAYLETLVRLSAAEDRVDRDVTCRSLAAFLKQSGRPEASAAGTRSVDFAIRAKSPGVFAGRLWLERVAARAGWALGFARSDGERLEAQDLACSGQAPWASLLGYERLGLNFLQHLSGIATQTRALVDQVDAAWSAHPRKNDFPAPGIYHTRKTLPLLRDEQLAAVLAGGGRTHRRDLSSRFMAKDNHKDLLRAAGLAYADWAAYALREATSGEPPLFEVDAADEALALARAGVRCLLLDNFSPAEVADLVPRLPADTQIEVSGGITAQTLADYVQPGVHRISVGALTHSVRALDLSLEIALEARP